MKVKPISPSEIVYEIPDFVIEAVNTLLKNNFRGGECTIKAKDIIAEGRRNGQTNSNKDWFQEKWMDFEKVFEKHGWKVAYEAPDRGSTNFDAYYTFTPKKK